MTILDVAKKAGVLVSTVSNILNNKDISISEKTRERVLGVINEMGYVPYAKIREKVLTEQSVLGALISDVADLSVGTLVSCLEHQAFLQGYTLMLYYVGGSHDKEKRILQILTEKRVDGLIAIQRADWQFDYKALDALNIPYFVIAYQPQEYEFPILLFDYADAAQQATSHLIECGHRSVALLLESSKKASSVQSIKGYRQVLHDNEMFFDDTLVFDASADKQTVFDNLMQCGNSAVICENNEIAFDFYSCAAKCFVSIPKDISVISLFDTTLGTRMVPELTAIHFSFEDTACYAVGEVIEKIKEHNPPRFTRYLKGTLARRESVAAVNTNGSPAILFAGDLLMELTLRLPGNLRPRQLAHASETILHHGGSIVTQADTAVGLGGNAILAGRLGNDLNGKRIYQVLKKKQFNLTGVYFENRKQTKAYRRSLLSSELTSFPSRASAVFARNGSGMPCGKLPRLAARMEYLSYYMHTIQPI